MLKTKAIIDIFRTQFFLFSFISNSRQMCCGGQEGGGQGSGGQRGGGVGPIGAEMIILSVSCLALNLFGYMFEVKS